MNNLKIVFIAIVMFFVLFQLNAAEQPEGTVYKHRSSHRTITSDNIRIHFPSKIEPAIPRILASFVEIRKRLLVHFPKQNNTLFDVILTNHDDCIEFSSDVGLDILKLEVFEEIGVLSSRGYSLEKRFALKLAHIMLLKEISGESNKLLRSIGDLAIPEWFTTGLTFHYAFRLDSLHVSRLIDMARHGRIYNIRQLATLESQPEVTREEMMFQCHSMLSFWENKYGKDSGIKLFKNIVRHPSTFLTNFKRYYGVSLNAAYNEYVNYIINEAGKADYIDSSKLLVEDGISTGKYSRSYRHIDNNTVVWVSSKRYSTETYDLFSKINDNEPVLIIKNVHPVLFYNKQSDEIIFGKYFVNEAKQKRLGLWAVNLSTGQNRCIVKEPGSFKPLGILDNRIYFTSIRNGLTRIMSVDITGKKTEKIEYVFSSDIRPLDLCMNEECDKIYFVYETVSLQYKLSVIKATNKVFSDKPTDLMIHDGKITSLVFNDKKLWFAAEKDYFMQLYRLNEKDSSVEQFTKLPGGVWDISFYNKKIDLLTLNDGMFKITSIEQNEEPIATFPVNYNEQNEVEEEKSEVESVPYKSLYAKGFWVPSISTDDEGYVLGVTTYQRDLLGRSEFSLTPTYGFSSQNTGYLTSYSQRLGEFKLYLAANQQTIKRSYLSRNYYEKSIQQQLSFEYPLNLSSKINFGFDMSERSIRKLKYDGNIYPVPTMGQDNSFFAVYDHIAVRTEPYFEIFPRKGRTIQAVYKCGTDIAGGDMEYNSLRLKWNEYIPLSSKLVASFKFYAGEDSRVGDLRRPEDLSLGGDDLDSFLKAYDTTYKSGDRLRASSIHLGLPLDFRFPRFMSWIYNEFAVGEIYAELGDVISSGNFNWVYDRGVEFKSKILLFKKLPLRLTAGYAIQNGHDDGNSYFKIDYTSASNLFK